MFDEQNFDELIRKSINRENIGRENFDCLPFVKFVRLFHRQSFALYGIYVIHFHNNVHVAAISYMCAWSVVTDHEKQGLNMKVFA